MAARRASCVLAPPLDSRRPSVVSCLCRRLDSGAAGRLCAGAASRLEASARRLSSHRRLDSGAASSGALDSGAARQQCAGAASRLETPVRRLSSRRRLDSGAASSCALDGGAARQQCAGAYFDSRPPSVASRLIAVWTAARRAAVRWTAARRASCVLAPPLDSRRPSVASRLCRRLDSGAASSCALDGGAARQQCAGAASRLEAPVRRLSSHRRLDSGAASSGALDSGAARQQCASAYFDSRPPSVASRLIAVWTAARRAAVRWTAARRASCVLAPPLDSRRPSVASRLCRRLDSGAAGWLCAGAASRLETPVRRLSFLPPPVQRRGEAAVRWTAARRGSSALAPPLDSKHPSVASRLCRRLDSGATRQQCDGAASRLEASVRRACLIAVWTAVRRGGCALAPPSTRDARPSPLVSVAASTAARRTAVRWTAARRGSSAQAPPSTRGLRPSPLVSSPPVQWRGEQLCAGRRRGEPAACWRRPSTRDARPSPLVSSPSGQWRGEQRCAGQRRS